MILPEQKQKCSCSPVCCKPRGDVSSGDLCNDVAPEERAVDQSYRLWIPVELGFLKLRKKYIINRNKIKTS